MSEEEKTQSNTNELVTVHSFDRLSAAFENSARRWELIVYPSLFAFILLAAYGFYLIYSLTKDVHLLVVSVDTHMTTLASNMQSVSQNMNNLTVSIDSINGKVGALEPMLTNMTSIEKSLQGMTWATHNIRGDMSNLNHSISRPMGFMNNFVPW
jgi:uncharacterized protein YoxC